MKIAICFYGLAGKMKNFQSSAEWLQNSADESLGCDLSYNHYKHHIFDKNDNIDIFLHTWSIEQEDELKELYKPKDSIFEKQKEFEGIKLDSEGKPHRKTWGAFSRWYSTKKSIELKTKYELENNFTYECVMLTRFDISFMTDLIFNKYDMNYIYASGQKNKNHVHVSSNKFISDWWFFSNSNVMNEFSKVYDELDEIGPYGGWQDQHRMSKAKIIKMGMNDKIKYLFNRDDDNKLTRELINNPQCRCRGNWWYHNEKTNTFYPDKNLPMSELNPGTKIHKDWKY